MLNRFRSEKGDALLVVVIIVLLLILGGTGLAVEALRFLLWVALIVLILGIVFGYRGRGSRRW